MFISRLKYSGVEFATGDTRTLMLYKGAPTCQWKNICEHVKRRPAKERLTNICFNRPVFGLGLNQMIMNLHDSNISRPPRTMAIMNETSFACLLIERLRSHTYTATCTCSEVLNIKINRFRNHKLVYRYF